MSILNQMGFVDENDNETVYDLEDSAAQASILAIEGKIPSNASSSNKMATASDITDINNKIPSNASSSNKLATISDVSAAYKPKGNATLATLPSLTAEHLNWVYNMTEDFTTTSDFAEGAGKSVKAGNEVGIIDISTTSTPSYKYTVLGGFIDTSGFQNKTLDTPITVDGTQKTTVETALQAINTLAANVKSAVGTLSSLTTTVKTNIVAAINELVTSISGINAKIPSGASSSNKMATASDVNAKVSWSDAEKSVQKNILRNSAISKTENNVTFTVNSDGTVSVSTTNEGASADTILVLATNTFLRNTLEVGVNYILSGCPSGGADNKYFLSFTNNVDGSRKDMGSGITFTDYDRTTYTNVSAVIMVRSGQIISTPILFKPMIRLATIIDDVYAPYIPDNTELMTWEANRVLGVKNLLKYPYDDTKVESGSLTFTVNDDGSVTVNGTSSSDFSYIRLDNLKNINIENNKRYIVSGKNSNDNCYVYIYGGSSRGSRDIVKTNNAEEVLYTHESQYTRYIYIGVPANKTIDNLTIYPMIRLVDDPDPTYQPYAMTNRELTENVTPIDIKSQTTIKSGLTDYSINEGYKVHKIGGMVYIYAIITSLTQNVMPDLQEYKEILSGLPKPLYNVYPYFTSYNNVSNNLCQIQIAEDGKLKARGGTTNAVYRIYLQYITAD